MAKSSNKRNFFGKPFWCGVLAGMFLYVVVCIGLIVGFVSGIENFRFDMLLDEDVWDIVHEEVKNRVEGVFKNRDEDEGDEAAEIISFEGVKMREVANFEMVKYIDFTIPFNWTFGKVEVENPSTEEAVVVTGENVVMTIHLRNIEMDANEESIIWTEEALVFELKNEYPDYLFVKSNLFDNKVAIVQGTTEESNAKLYIAVIPIEDKTIYISYSFMTADWLAELYFTTVIDEILNAY